MRSADAWRKRVSVERQDETIFNTTALSCQLQENWSFPEKLVSDERGHFL
jgi:hypothetical protein